MRAAVLHESPGALVIDDVDVDGLCPDEVLVRTRAAGLCHSDLHHLEGHMPGQPLPRVLGHESTGVVEAVGSAVTDIAVGDHVVTCPSVFCGDCEWCLSGHPSLCDQVGTARPLTAPPRLSWQGQRCGQSAGLAAFAELMVVHHHAVAVVPDDVPPDVLAPIGCAVLTGIGAVWHTAQVEPGSTVAVVGCGGVGVNCVQGAALAGASRIVAIDTNPAKLELAARFGATDLVDAGGADPVQQVRDLLPGRVSAGVDYSFEAVGHPATAAQAFRMLRKGGTATVIGVMPPGAEVTIAFSDLIAERRIQGSVMGSNRFRQDVPRFLDLYRQGRLRLDELVSARITLDDVNDGFAALARGDVARSVIVFP
jgi:S-(hydroxymethyl)glutathione dehydrogenase / alcohol dehydrogenase